MKISGRELAKEVYENIHKKLAILTEKNIIPKLIIIKSNNSAAVNNYIGQKVKKGKRVGVEVDIVELSDADCKNRKKIEEQITKINTSPKNQGIIFQKPGSERLNEDIESFVDPRKDVDGFLEKSYHKPPVYRGVMSVFENIVHAKGKKLLHYLTSKKIVLIGKGKTGGQTIISGLKKDGFNMNLLTIIDSKTPENKRTEYIKGADIVISAVGKLNPVDFHLFSKEIILVDIGVHFDEQNKIKGDFNEEDIKDRVAFYTTTPGGIGALTVGYLLDNVVNAAMDTITN